MTGFEEAWESLYSGQHRPWRGAADLSWVPLDGYERILDAGCGNGKCTEALISKGMDVTGVDFSPSAIGQCIRRFGDKAVFLVSDIRSLPFPDDSFDAVLAVHSIEHLEKETEHLALSEFARVLRPGGRLFLQVFATGDFRSGEKDEDVRNGILYRYHSEDSLRDTLSDWTIQSMERVTENTRFGEVRQRIRCIATVNP